MLTRTLKPLFLSLTALLFASSAIARNKQAAPSPEFAAITVRGRLLAGYMNAASQGRLALEALHPPQGSITHYFARQIETGWMVYFGRCNDTGDKFLVAYEAIPGGSAQQFSARAVEPPCEHSDFCLDAARAIDTAMKDFHAPRPYRFAVLPADSNQMYVYAVPAETVRAGTFTAGMCGTWFRRTASPLSKSAFSIRQSSNLQRRGSARERRLLGGGTRTS